MACNKHLVSEKNDTFFLQKQSLNSFLNKELERQNLGNNIFLLFLAAAK